MVIISLTRVFIRIQRMTHLWLWCRCWQSLDRLGGETDRSEMYYYGLDNCPQDAWGTCISTELPDAMLECPT